MDVELRWTKLSGELEDIRQLEEQLKDNFHNDMIDLDTFADRQRTRDDYVCNFLFSDTLYQGRVVE